MNKIDYNDRSKWEEFVSEDTNFIKSIIPALHAQCVLDVPCGNGRSLDVIQPLCERVIFGDINPLMVEEVHKKIQKRGYENCEVIVIDLCDLSNIKIYQERNLLLIMQQSIQLLNRDQIQMFFENIKRSAIKNFVIDIYDFESKASDVPQYLRQPTVRWNRKSEIIKTSPKAVILNHHYSSIYGKKEASITLQNYTRSEFMHLCKINGFRLVKLYSRYDLTYFDADGRSIFLIENCI